ncbi:ribose-phosphate pyrophosphokinase [Candidatus Saccharibacteria bacterium]|nr:ribose-phosphate pyrophosphokinase [Candidatus Saccharibacteria bacterium]NIS37895.1 ribose-phosphate pyrophosphokinase [Candidatus Saccharibacteria bacterium]NIV03350.1 ribose-phosphate diphosphokinase [Calditrichia bacterium]NIV71558.1 ribose-phosphate diphosphokinase [Calditrichia bacterium]NIW78421.1 ribose-phosphate diphosphokinase [Calditrichia bacterium]
MILYTLETHSILEKEIIKKTQAESGSFFEKVFNNGEYYVKLNQEVKGKKAVIFSVVTEPKDQVMKILFLINALKSNKATKIILVIPYYPYSRQDRVHEPGEPISAELMAGLFHGAGANKIVTLDIHNRRGLGKFKKYLLNIDTTELISENLKKAIDSSWVVVAPDAGAKKRASSVAKHLKIKKVAFLKKTRPKPGQAKILEISGDSVKDEKVIIIDDMIDTGGTLIKAANFLRERGAKQVMAACTHGIFSQNALKNINQSVIMKVFATDSLPINQSGSGKLVNVGCGDLLAKTIKKYA